MNIIKKNIKTLIAIFSVPIILCLKQKVDAPASVIFSHTISRPELVDKFYKLNHQKLFWFSDSTRNVLRKVFKEAIDSAAYLGLNSEDYNADLLQANVNRSFSKDDSSSAMEIDRVFTDAAIAYVKDIYCGQKISSWVNADEISSKYAEQDNNYLLQGLIGLKTEEGLKILLSKLEPDRSDYRMLKKAFRDSLNNQNMGAAKHLAVSLNFTRWLYHFKLEKFAVVNIPSAILRYYEYDSVKLKMRVVVGKPSTRTPRLAVYCNQVILYPYWNVPRKIAVNELLPLFKEFPTMIDSMNMQIIDGRGHIVNPEKLPWKQFNKNNFPYEVRQSTGCDNALGVIKFNLTSPYDVYMHDTNFKLAFISNRRYYSHGCIRLEKPVELGNYFLDNKLDQKFLASCMKDQKPITLRIAEPIPVFVVYMPAEVSEDAEIKYYDDVYGLLQ